MEYRDKYVHYARLISVTTTSSWDSNVEMARSNSIDGPVCEKSCRLFYAHLRDYRLQRLQRRLNAHNGMKTVAALAKKCPLAW
ncbi:hypothetical protein X777_04417 [Ooceraea biroi]|uniref:Uncharacterized protein n=1 Tax=Ooceraea biroi TaxID=2015173 RepID=A0A026WIM6_OOCBI|nr:hypothetical protein X777_04417 [Ooceraea biroi]